ncbi:MAG TPA: MarR family transcriptional regulator [Candidatus Dormibacteraeota bacterium]|jgi:DNA-binding MarR family transcriptional regulator|nr:MarR family transcriptional regulator [Candidatus Dormibacteraeota bacterium]
MPDDEGVAAWSALLRCHAALVGRLENELQSARGLSLAWYDVLQVLASAPERRLRMSELGERVVVSRTRVSRIVDEMVDAGLAVREPDPSDRRSWFAAITREGRATLRRASPVYRRGVVAHFSRHLGAGEIEVIREALERVLAELPAVPRRPGGR